MKKVTPEWKSAKLDPAVHTALKAHAAELRVSLSDLLDLTLREYLAKQASFRRSLPRR